MGYDADLVLFDPGAEVVVSFAFFFFVLVAVLVFKWACVRLSLVHPFIHACMHESPLIHPLSLPFTAHHVYKQVTKSILQFKNKASPYEGMTLRGRVLKTLVRGNVVYSWGGGGGGEGGVFGEQRGLVL